jgi:hypothetical protein
MECKNCQTHLVEKSDYCHHCGAKVIRNRLTLKNLFSHFVETFFSYDNSFLKTIVNLLKNPKDVIESYVNGVRKKYIAPLAFFAIAITVSGIYLFILKKYFPNFFEIAESFYTDDVSKDIGKKITEFTTEFNSLLNFLLIPLFALLSRIVFLKNKYNFTEHLVIYFYTLSLFSMVSVLVNLIMLLFFSNYLLAFSGVLYSLFFIYQCYVLKKVFTLSYKQLIIKILWFLPLFFLLYIIVSIVAFVLILVFGDFSLQDFVTDP